VLKEWYVSVYNRGMERASGARAGNWVWWVVAWLLLLGAVVPYVWFGLDYRYVSTDNETDYAVPSDVIIVLGCPSYEGNVISTTFSACVQARAHHAAELYSRGMAEHIIPTGGLTGPPPSEAGAMAQVMEADGVPTAAIFLEEQARNTSDNIVYSQAIMGAHGWHTAILVSEPNHIKRAAVVASDLGLNFVISPATDSAGWNTPSARQENLWRDTKNLMTYQARRWLGFP
jgi:uncharacterized SAM-binding protein YcdF (DUF218 family)